ncbi:hypothetical protein D3C86_1789200 [compost metagenome]
MVMRELVHLSNNFTCPEGSPRRLKRYAEQAELLSYRIAGDQEGVDLMTMGCAPSDSSVSEGATDINYKDEVRPLSEEEEQIWH